MWSFIPFKRKRKELIIPENCEVDIEYIFILAKEDASTQKRIKDILDIVEKHEGMVESIVGPLIIVLFGAPLASENSLKNRDALIQDLRKNLGNSLSIVFGHTKCFVGIVGNEKRKAYTAMIPNYKEKINILTSIELGKQVEVK